MKQRDHAGVYFPPPFIYAGIFLLSLWIQNRIPLEVGWKHSLQANAMGWTLIAISQLFSFSALRKFFITKNTLNPHKPARSLATGGIYSYSRNPMYFGLLLLYSGLAFLLGNWWTFILIPLLIVIVQLSVIKKEELYLASAFGEEYDDYRKRVRRWI